MKKKEEIFLEKRIVKLEMRMDDIHKELSQLIRSIEDLKSQPKIIQTRTNPWVVQAQEAMRRMDVRATVERLSTYKRSVEVILKAGKPLDALEISKLTGRSRNLESMYLKRLYSAGLVDRTREGRKVKYKIVDKKMIHRLFSQ
jgi:DNA-binding transcriptional ArsR family regulator